MSVTAKLVCVLAALGLVIGAFALDVPAVPGIVLAVSAALLLNGYERYAAKRDLWPD